MPKIVNALGIEVLPSQHEVTKTCLASKAPIPIHVITTFAHNTYCITHNGHNGIHGMKGNRPLHVITRDGPM